MDYFCLIDYTLVNNKHWFLLKFYHFIQNRKLKFVLPIKKIFTMEFLMDTFFIKHEIIMFRMQYHNFKYFCENQNLFIIFALKTMGALLAPITFTKCKAQQLKFLKHINFADLILFTICIYRFLNKISIDNLFNLDRPWTYHVAMWVTTKNLSLLCVLDTNPRAIHRYEIL